MGMPRNLTSKPKLPILHLYIGTKQLADELLDKGCVIFVIKRSLLWKNVELRQARS